MHAAALVVRSFRNLADAELELPPDGMALIGDNGQGKTNVLEALAYPVLFRSLRGAADREIGRIGGPGFHVALTTGAGAAVATTFTAAAARKRITVNGEERRTVASALGEWLAVAFLPTDLALVRGGAAERRRWLDRMLSLADHAYLAALLRYRAALAQRNAALRAGGGAAVEAFNVPLAHAGALVVARRLAWAAWAAEPWRSELEQLGESAMVALRYRGDVALADAAEWPARLAASAGRDTARGQTHVGPHRDDLVLSLGGHALRDYGSTGQQRSAAIALRLLELDTLARAREADPALLVDDVFAELDRERRNRLAARLLQGTGQRVITAPHGEELPAILDLPRWSVVDGAVHPAVREAA
ncbi:MAG TPA: DNA replication and repair protein RecF [Gemmatimonadales bacterium]|jgi:DNA replication and repair protein RecF|nr:DNA replication and repair protein RecF [Gemmatimonadales bacterium]